ncbi:MAG: type II secretion system minor pseudopilin GspJ [Burkholderiales bacterium]|nr:type II secretion system minor pseudopilin GspJ [Rhodocyclaceae bacterium]MCA3053416.1 type II secretion system minor pseudopilin GspJ [Rhodocyclaceae bacterium]MCA3083633.1 type II secretion system minor pseudopilin GspJ [Rhodocyclaceae bacterium]
MRCYARCQGRYRESGFTLIEVTVALLVFAVLTLIGYRTVSSMFDARQHLAVQTSKLRDQALFLTRIESDLGSILPRTVKNADGVSEPALKVLAAASSAIDPVIVFSRSGFAGATGINAAPQRIGYRLNEGKLELLIWEGVDVAPRAQPAAYTALNNVREFRWRVLDAGGSWRTDWPTRDDGSTASFASTALPAALELTLTQGDTPPIVRLFALREVSGG